MADIDLNIIFWIVLGIFTLGAAFLATGTLTNVIRLRNVRLSWSAGKMGGYPLFSSLFMFSAILTGILAVNRGSVVEMVTVGFYGWLSVCWFTTSYFSTKRFITDYGIVKNVNEPSQTVAWHQIRDFVEKEKKEHIHYIFIYSLSTNSPNDLIRLELDVPNKQEKYFKKIISHKLGRRIRCYIKDDIDIEEFNRS